MYYYCELWSKKYFGVKKHVLLLRTHRLSCTFDLPSYARSDQQVFYVFSFLVILAWDGQFYNSNHLL